MYVIFSDISHFVDDMRTVRVRAKVRRLGGGAVKGYLDQNLAQQV